jgi:DNA polymerase
MAACQPFLRRQLEVIDPALVVTLGRFSLQAFRPGDRISGVHGTTRTVDPQSGARAASAYAMYHPAAALRQASLHETMQRDMAGIPEALLRSRAARQGLAAEGAPALATAAAGTVGITAAAMGGTAAAIGGTAAAMGGTAAEMGGTTAAIGGTAAAVRHDDQLGLF